MNNLKAYTPWSTDLISTFTNSQLALLISHDPDLEDLLDPHLESFYAACPPKDTDRRFAYQFMNHRRTENDCSQTYQDFLASVEDPVISSRRLTPHRMMMLNRSEMRQLSILERVYGQESVNLTTCIGSSTLSPWVRKLAYLCSMDERLSLIEGLVLSLPLNVVRGLYPGNKLEGFIDCSWYTKQQVKEWNRMDDWNDLEKEFLRQAKSRRIPRTPLRRLNDITVVAQVKPIVVSEYSQYRVDSYGAMISFFSSPEGIQKAFAAPWPDRYFRIESGIEPGVMRAAGCHPVTIGMDYMTTKLSTKARYDDLFIQISGDFVWSDKYGLMSRTDRAKGEEGPFHCVLYPDNNTKWSLPYLDTTRQIERLQRDSLLQSAELVRGKKGIRSLFEQCCNQPYLYGSVLSTMAMELHITKINCRHEGCSCEMRVVGPKGCSLASDMKSGFGPGLLYLVHRAWLWYLFTTSCVPGTISFDVELGGKRHWFPCDSMSSVSWEVLYCTPDVPLDILTIIESHRVILGSPNISMNIQCFQGAEGAVIRGHEDRYSIPCHQFNSTMVPFCRLYQRRGDQNSYLCDRELLSIPMKEIDLEFPFMLVFDVFDPDSVRITEGRPSVRTLGCDSEVEVVRRETFRREVAYIFPPLARYYMPWITFVKGKSFASLGLLSSIPFGAASLVAPIHDVSEAWTQCYTSSAAVGQYGDDVWLKSTIYPVGESEHARDFVLPNARWY